MRDPGPSVSGPLTTTDLAERGARTRAADQWRYDPAGHRRGFIQSQQLKELWFHTGTVCNLRCSFCMEGSKPGDNRLNPITLGDVKPFIEEALKLGVQQFSFTGGEPFVIPEMVSVLEFSLNHKPCLVLTNATEPLLNQLGRLALLAAKPFPLSFRVSLDYPDPEHHDAERGKGNFALALRTMKELHTLGFDLSIARQCASGENVDAVNAAYAPFLRQAELPETVPIIAFPEFHEPGSDPEVPHITEACMTTYKTDEQRARFMCTFSRMVVKQGGRMRVYACTLVDDDPDYDLGGTIAEALDTRVMLKHHRCYTCFANNASCSEL